MRPSRRAVLAACGAGLSTLAGCSRLGVGEESPSFDTARLVALGEEDVPRPPATFPVSITDAMVSRHRERARELVERVPAQPDVPGESVAEQLRADRATVLERLDEDGDAANDPLERLDDARDAREKAAAVEAAYRAATEGIAPEAVADRRAKLRSTLLAFERDWEYRGDDPGPAIVVHGAFEELLLAARPAVEPERSFPDNPGTLPLRAGENVGHLEAGHAAVADAERLRTRYRDGLSDPRPYRTAMSVAASRLRRITRRYRHDLDDYIGTEPGTYPFDRTIEDTPLELLYSRVTDGLELYRADAEEARHRGDHATALVETGIHLTVLRALEAIVADIEDDRVAVPETADDVAAARREAIDGLQRAWATTPATLATDLAVWAYGLVDYARYDLRGKGEEDYTPPAGAAYDAWAQYVTAARVAAAVPPTVVDTAGAVRAAAE